MFQMGKIYLLRSPVEGTWETANQNTENKNDDLRSPGSSLSPEDTKRQAFDRALCQSATNSLKRKTSDQRVKLVDRTHIKWPQTL